MEAVAISVTCDTGEDLDVKYWVHFEDLNSFVVHPGRDT